jgi:hypothetical protein
MEQLKHRGGPGFGHGRLQGKELTLLSEKLRYQLVIVIIIASILQLTVLGRR